LSNHHKLRISSSAFTSTCSRMYIRSARFSSPSWNCSLLLLLPVWFMPNQGNLLLCKSLPMYKKVLYLQNCTLRKS